LIKKLSRERKKERGGEQTSYGPRGKDPYFPIGLRENWGSKVGRGGVQGKRRSRSITHGVCGILLEKRNDRAVRRNIKKFQGGSPEVGGKEATDYLAERKKVEELLEGEEGGRVDCGSSFIAKTL